MHSGHPQRIIPVLYEDESYIVFDKPAGVLVIPAPGETKQTLVDIVNRQYAPAQVGGSCILAIASTGETSGAIIFAKEGAAAGDDGAFSQASGEQEIHRLCPWKASSAPGRVAQRDPGP